MKWSETQPKVSGYYWLQRPPVSGVGFCPTIVKVKISDDPEWPEATYSSCNYEMDWDFIPGSKWAGPIPPPKG